MADKEGTPKLLMEVQSLFGNQKTEVVQVDSNDLDPIAQAKQAAISAFIHPTLVDAIGDAACWFCGSAFLGALFLHTPVLIFLQIPIALCFITAGAGTIALTKFVPELGMPIMFRVLLIAAGLLLGIAS